MLEFRQKKKIRRMLYSPVTLVLLVIILLILVKSLWGVYAKAQLSALNLEKERKELDRLALREKTLASSIEFLKTDKGIENEIRTKFRAVKEGEQVAVIVDNDTSTAPAVVSSTEPGFWATMFGWFR